MALVDRHLRRSRSRGFIPFGAGILATYKYEVSATCSFLAGSTLAEPVDSRRYEGSRMVVLRLVLVFESWWISTVYRSGWSSKNLR